MAGTTSWEMNAHLRQVRQVSRLLGERRSAAAGVKDWTTEQCQSEWSFTRAISRIWGKELSGPGLQGSSGFEILPSCGQKTEHPTLETERCGRS
jgi:hypothetical protein